MADTFRKVYTPLTDDQKKQVEVLKQSAEVIESFMDAFIAKEERSERSRCMNLARTKLEETVMWAVKGVTTQHEA